MKIAIITDFVLGQYFGGGERRYFEVLTRLAKKGHKIDIYCMKSNKKQLYNNKNINIIQTGPRIKNPPHRNVFQILFFTKLIFFKLMFKKYDVIEAQGPSILSLFFLRIFGKKNTIALIHDLSSGDKDQWFMNKGIAEKIEKLIYKLPTAKTITVSNNVKKRLETEYKRKNVTVIHNGVDENLIDSISTKKQNQIIFVGRLIKHKHVDDLIVATKDIDINVKIVGSGPENNNLKKLAHKNVEFLGTLPDFKDVIKEIKSSKILVLPSTREGFGLVLAEAMYAETPVIAYKSDGASEVLDESSGILIKQRDIDGLKKAIIQLLNNKKRYEEFQINGKNRVKTKFLWKQSIEKLEKLYSN